MTCKDCIHRELCADYVSSLAKVKNADVKYISQWLDEIEGKRNQTDGKTGACEDCRAEHMMLGSWLRELKLRRELELQNPPQLAELPRVGD